MAARSGFRERDATRDLGPASTVRRKGDPMHVTGRQSGMTQNRKLCRGRSSNIFLPAFALAVWVYAAAAWAQSDPALPNLTADQVVQHLIEKNQERAAALQHYLGKRSYRLEYHGFPASAEATMDVEVNFDAPATKHFTVVSSTGSKMIQNRVFHK